jgi:hypothetical protein
MKIAIDVSTVDGRTFSSEPTEVSDEMLDNAGVRSEDALIEMLTVSVRDFKNLEYFMLQDAIHGEIFMNPANIIYIKVSLI